MKVLEYKKQLLFLGILAFLGLCQWQSYIFLPGHGLDPSWQASLGLVNASDSLFYGKDYAFTYGPAFFLMTGYMATTSMLMNLAIICGLNILFAALKTILVTKLMFGFTPQEKFAKFCKMTVVALLFSVNDKVYFCDFAVTLVFFLLYDLLLLLRDKRFTIGNYVGKVIVSVILLALLPMVKFSYVFIAVVGLLCIFGILAFHKKFISAIFSLIFFLLSGGVFWLVLGQKLEYLPTWLYYGMQQAFGYTETMAVTQIWWWPNWLFGVVFCLLCVAGWFMMLREDKLKAFILFIGVSLLFLNWKEAFVRADGYHTFIFYVGAVFALVLTTYVMGKEPFTSCIFTKEHIKKLTGVALVGSAFLIVFINGFSLSDGLYKDLLSDAALVYRSNRRVALNKIELRKSYGYFAPFADSIASEDTVDIFPWDISLLYGYDLNYNPRLSVQSYSDYTGELDSETADGFVGSGAPDKVIFTGSIDSLQAIDGRYAVFDEPQTFRTLLNNYTVVKADVEHMLLLQHTKDVMLTESIIHTAKSKLGENIQVPQSSDSYIYMSIDIKTTILGSFTNFFFKLPHDTITVTTTDGVEHTSPFIRRVAPGGLYVTSYIENLADLQDVFNGDVTENIASIRIDGNSLFYSKEFEVKFFTTTEVP